MSELTRREFTRQALRSLTAVALIEGLAGRHLLGADVKPIVDAWLVRLNEISRELKDHKLKDLAFQEELEGLYRRVDLPGLLKTLDFDRLVAATEYPAKGARSLPVDLDNVAGLSTGAVFGRQIFAMRAGRSVIPHGHDNMATGFLVLKGTFKGRHWDRVEDHKDHYVIRPTIDRTFQVGEFSTISDHKDNVHWFTSETETGFLFNIHVLGYNTENPRNAGRVYVDPLGEKIAGGLILAPKLTFGKANQKFG